MSSIENAPPARSALDAQVLVLNRVYSAIRIVDARKAFTFLAKSVAEVISLEQGNFRNYDFGSWTDIADLQREFESEQHDWVRTPSMTLAVPKIIRLFSYDRRPSQDIRLNRRNIYARDESACQYCGRKFSTRELSLDHVIPRVQGGEDSWTNLVCACVRCNARKGGRTPRQANMRLVKKPIKPRLNQAIQLRIGSRRYQSWKAFIDEAYWTIGLS